MTQLAYSLQRPLAALATAPAALLKDLFRATPLGIFIAALQAKR